MYQRENCMFVPYTLLATFMYYAVRFITNDKVIADYGVPIVYNVGYLGIVLSSLFHTYCAQQRATLINHVISALVGYYSMDTVNLYFDKTAKYRLAYMIHHLVSIQLLQLHYSGVLPLSVGILYLTLFELSNLFLIPYQLCLYKKWDTMRYKLVHLMVFTYVPLRVIAIPICSIWYWYSFEKNIPEASSLVLTQLMYTYCKMLLSLLNIFSVYYGIAIGYKYYLYFKIQLALKK